MFFRGLKIQIFMAAGALVSATAAHATDYSVCDQFIRQLPDAEIVFSPLTITASGKVQVDASKVPGYRGAAPGNLNIVVYDIAERRPAGWQGPKVVPPAGTYVNETVSIQLDSQDRITKLRKTLVRYHKDAKGVHSPYELPMDRSSTINVEFFIDPVTDTCLPKRSEITTPGPKEGTTSTEIWFDLGACRGLADLHKRKPSFNACLYKGLGMYNKEFCESQQNASEARQAFLSLTREAVTTGRTIRGNTLDESVPLPAGAVKTPADWTSAAAVVYDQQCKSPAATQALAKIGSSQIGAAATGAAPAAQAN
jgi:hypothetical protein